MVAMSAADEQNPEQDPMEPTPLAEASLLHGDVLKSDCDALVVNLFEGVSAPGGATGAVDAALDGAITELIAAGDLEGKVGQVAVLYPRGAVPARRVLVTGLGPAEKFSTEVARRAAANAARKAVQLGASTVHTIAHGAGVGGLDVAAAAQATVEGSLLAGYSFRGWKSGGSGSGKRLTGVTVVEADAAKLELAEAGVSAAKAVAAGVGRARDLVNRPPNRANPQHVAAVARQVAESVGLDIEVGDRDWLERERMGALLAVAAGSRNEPAFIVMTHNAERDDLPTVVLVGKGVTFDTGGLSLKTRDGMVPMKADMAGAAAVIGAMEVVATLGVELRVVGLCPCVENMPDGAAYRPSDVVVASNGVSIEILSTDAEGRLALAEALAFARRYEADAVVDLATLTGSSVVALGAGVSASLFASDDDLAAELESASSETGERVWRMPLFDEYRKAIDAKVADLKNSGGARGGVGTAAVFLERFTDYPWAHVDMAGMELVDSPGDRAYLTAGATGYGVRLLVEFLRRRADRRAAR